MKRNQRLRATSDFSRLRKKGRSVAGRHLVLSWLEDSDVEEFQAGLITTRKIGNAVVRNRVRRRLRAMITDGPSPRSGIQFVLIARFRAPRASYQALQKEWLWLGRKARLFSPS